ncbi:MAG: hypothetical protein KKB21_02545 [Nanoarchaeota archaeon]|nr:hypothetical protein [Nanoarchaeota archaeon]MBU4086435.1 hypothetical protein [Nanoarchaeota archaeon]
MNSKLSSLLLTAALTAGCAYNRNYQRYSHHPQPIPQQVIQQPIQQPRQVSHEDMKKWYRVRTLKYPHKELEGKVNVSSEFMAAVIDQATYSPPELKFDDWYPTYEFYPGDLVGFFCFAKNNETTAANMMIYSPSGRLIEGKGFAIDAGDKDHIVGRLYSVSKLIGQFGEGEYQCRWFFHATHVKTSLASLKR